MLSLDATLNPTRYVAHQSARAWAAQPLSAWNLGEPNLYRRPSPRRAPGEVVLDQEDNVLLGPAAERFGRPEAWPLHIHRYWSAFTEEIDGAIRVSADVGGAVVEEMSPHLNIKVVETYWEFATDDPTGLVAELEPILFQLGREPAARTFGYPEGLLVGSRRHNAKAVRVRLRPGLSLQVYAKTTGRVRFEIMHELTKSASLLRDGHVCADWGMLPLWLERLAERAADDLNGALAAIQNLSFEPADSAHIYALVRRLMAVSASDHMADAVLSLLVNNRSLRIGVRDPMRPAATALVASGVLEKERERYTLAPRYRRAVRELAVQRRVLRRQRFRSPPSETLTQDS
jgi:hypothetical protein